MEENKLTIDVLNGLFTDGKTCDDELFAEQRSNILLASGDHYARKHSKWWNRIRDSRELTQEQKLRLTKNHIHRISRIYQNNILAQAPGVIPVPNNPKELQDQKAAELNKSVWEYAKSEQKLKMQIHSWCKDFIDIGECAVKIFWDPMAGRFIGYEQEVDAEGTGVLDEQGKPKSNGKAVFSGDLVFERILGFNMIRAAEAKTMDSSRFLAIQKMVEVKTLKALVANDEEKMAKIQATQDETFFVFDGAKSNYTKSENQALVKEFYFRPCHEYPQGWFAITTGNIILSEGELPYGIFPIRYKGCDEIQTTPRHRSIIKQVRPYQYELNRAGSKQAEHQVTLGDDKVILQNGAKVTSGPQLPGVRTMFVTGQAPTILEGRSGAQFTDYIVATINEMYQVVNLQYDSEEKAEGGDAFANLYRSIREKKKFSIYAEKFEDFLVDVAKTYLELAKQYFDENMLIPAIGRSEYINIPEFKNQEPLCYQIRVEPQSEDPTTMMGKHLVLNHILQYVGQNLEKDDIGKIIRNMPFANSEEIYSDFTLNYDSATNIILALDRGQAPPVSKNDDGAYILKRLAARQKQADYRLLAPEIQQAYDDVISLYENMEAEKAAAIKAAENEFIPASGAAIKCDYYIPDPSQPTRSIRATVPAEALDWLVKRLAEQGSTQEQLAMQTSQVQAEIARRTTAQPPMQIVPGQQTGGMP